MFIVWNVDKARPASKPTSWMLANMRADFLELVHGLVYVVVPA